MMTEKKNRDDKAGRHDDRAEGHADVRRQRRPGWEHDIVTKQGDTPMTEQRGDDDNRAGGWWQRKGTRMTMQGDTDDKARRHDDKAGGHDDKAGGHDA